MPLSRTTFLCAILVLACLTPRPATGSGTAGDVDGSFGPDGDGILILSEADHATNSDHTRLRLPAGVALDQAGHMVVMGRGTVGPAADGSFTDAWMLRRFAADGTPDSRFGTAGDVLLFGDVAPGGMPQAFALDPGSSQRSAGIYVAGRAWVESASGKGKRQTVTTSEVVQLVRVLAEDAGGAQAGDLDPSFHSGSALTIGTLPVGDGFYGVGAIAVQADGKVLVVGTGPVPSAGGSTKGKGKGGTGSTQVGLVVARYTASGGLDTAYGDAGWARHAISFDAIHDARIQPTSGALVVLAQGHGILRLTSAGLRDASFGTIAESLTLRSLAVDADDRVYAASTDDVPDATGALVERTPVIYRYLAGGAPDADFGTDGIVRLEGLYGLAPWGLAVEDLGVGVRRLVVATGIYDEQDGGIVAARLLLEGHAGANPGDLDTSFGPAGDGVSEPLRKWMNPTGSETAALWNAWAVVVHDGGDVTLLDGATYYPTPSIVVDASLGRIFGG